MIRLLSHDPIALYGREPMHSPEKESPVVRWLTLLLLLTALLSAPALAADLDGTLKKIKRTKTITLGYQESARPFSFANAEASPRAIRSTCVRSSPPASESSSACRISS